VIPQRVITAQERDPRGANPIGGSWIPPRWEPSSSVGTGQESKTARLVTGWLVGKPHPIPVSSNRTSS